jgi:uncharacterized protein YpmB
MRPALILPISLLVLAAFTTMFVRAFRPVTAAEAEAAEEAAAVA